MDWANPPTPTSSSMRKVRIPEWEVELGSPSKLLRIGWKKDSIKMGDQVTITGWRARNGSNHANANTVTLPNGKKFLSAGGNLIKSS